MLDREECFLQHVFEINKSVWLQNFSSFLFAKSTRGLNCSQKKGKGELFSPDFITRRMPSTSSRNAFIFSRLKEPNCEREEYISVLFTKVMSSGRVWESTAQDFFHFFIRAKFWNGSWPKRARIQHERVTTVISCTTVATMVQKSNNNQPALFLPNFKYFKSIKSWVHFCS